MSLITSVRLLINNGFHFLDVDEATHTHAGLNMWPCGDVAAVWNWSWLCDENQRAHTPFRSPEVTFKLVFSYKKRIKNVFATAAKHF